MQNSGGAVGFLASVVSESEALICASLGADIIDAKNPAAGALGALPLATVRAIRAAVPAHVPVSATVGDPEEDADAVARAVVEMAATGVDIVKIGFRAGATAHAVVRRLSTLQLDSGRLVAVLLAEHGVDLDLVAGFARAGFAGVMLDTGDKKRGALPDIVGRDELVSFVAAAHENKLFAGLAGSLKAEHVPYLLSFSPDVLGFRGGLCRAGERVSQIDADAVRGVRKAVPSRGGFAIDTCREPRDNAIARFETESAV
ncbi:MAG TPA: hypothetical protein EYP98_01610 [Planctomycetes bacterium]|nr:hypothetical protein [Planctomycetota bacterium]